LARRTAFLIVRRLSIALVVAGLIAAVIRVRGRGGAPEVQSGWDELSFDQKP
jgi:hypothetical protein